MLTIVAVACLGAGLAACQPGTPPAPSPSAPASPVEGIIVAIDGSGLSDIRGFTLRLVGGATVAFHLGTLDNPTTFPPGHLKEHEATSQPIRVYFVLGADGPTVYRLEDAPGASPAAT